MYLQKCYGIYEPGCSAQHFSGKKLRKKATTYPSKSKWLNQLWYSHMLLYYTALRNEEVGMYMLLWKPSRSFIEWKKQGEE